MAKPTDAEIVDFVETFIGGSTQARAPMVEGWAETLDNYLVRPQGGRDATFDTGAPMYGSHYGGLNHNTFGFLKDPEIKQVIDTLLSKLMIALFSDDKYIAAKKRGREDATAAETTTQLLRYAFGLDGHRRAFQCWLLDMLLWGTGISQLTWRLDERPRTFRDIIGVDAEGNELRNEIRVPAYPVYDDVRLLNIDIMDFYPDFGTDNFRDMLGAAKRLDITGFDAMRQASKGLYNMEAVKAAIGSASKNSRNAPDKSWRTERAQNYSRHPGFEEFEAFEYYGEIPFNYPDGERWRVITIAGGQVLRDQPWPYDDYRLPFYDATISPIQGRLYGISPAEGARYQQDFLDFLLMMMAEAVTRVVRPPIIYNKDVGIDVAALDTWRVPIGVEDGNPATAISTLQYTPNLSQGFNMFHQIKNSIRENTGALGSIQGQGLGINRASATEAERTFQMALDRPEMFARYLEVECLPPLGRGTLKFYQQNLETSAELTDRIGEQPEPAQLQHIQGNYDVQFVGTRQIMSKQQQMANVDRVLTMAQIPQIGNLIDWNLLGVDILEGFGFDKLVEKIGNPMIVAQNLLMQRAAGGAGLQTANQNGAVSSNATNAETPAEAAGTTMPEGNFLGDMGQ